MHQLALEESEEQWADPKVRLGLVTGKEALGWINKSSQELYRVSVTLLAIIDAMRTSEIPPEMCDLVRMLTEFSAHQFGD